MKEIFDKGNLLYFVLSTPRSGSTMLSDYMESVGLGHPKEHLRKPVVDQFKNRPENFSGIDWACNHMAQDLAKGNVFGTKLISHFVAGANACLNEEERQFVEDIIPLFKPIYLYRKDKLLQAISTLRAQQSKIWLPRNFFKVMLARYKPYKYDYDEILKRFNRQIDADNMLYKELNGVYDKIHIVCYEDLVENKEAEMKKIFNYLGVNLNAAASTKLKVLRDKKSLNFAARFEDEYLKLSGTELDRYYLLAE